ncbi:uncharacterized protein LOC121991861 [Zingiber officinale]|uniref:uncharacterized protein LOC121991861 n=1 Tax=Zingiber officinale TaxID=94328 RepID=UPI001C4BCEB2|nr:uncharacterized protein LOC121991861 [Zingiber officinale]
MALFFDLSIPYLEDGGDPSLEMKSRKDARLETVVRAMELGYVGIAYDRHFRVISDSLRCSIDPFPLDSLLEVAPSLFSSAAFHRDLLGAPRSSTFRQYTRLTVSVTGAAAAVSLNGNALLKTYDLVAVRPLNQEAFDKACESSMVDIITLDFSQKLPFRLKISSIKLAIQRGLYFEVTYSHLIADSHVRRKILSDVKLLSDWSRGKNLLISSAASTVNDIRGPLDVANLAVFLLGLSAERAKYTISQNCRSLLANAIRKKRFYKETIRIERIISDGQSTAKEFQLDNWNEWDAISSEKGDLPSLNDIKNLSVFTCKQSFGLNSIDFQSIPTEPPLLLSENAKMMSSPRNSASPVVTPHEPCVVADDVTQDDSCIGTLLADTQNCQPVMVDKCVKIPDGLYKVSCTGLLVSAMAASNVDDRIIQPDANLTDSAVVKNKSSETDLVVQKISYQSNNHAFESLNDSAEFTNGIPKNGDPTSEPCKKTDNSGVFLLSNADSTPTIIKDNKFVEFQKSLNRFDDHVFEASNNSGKSMNLSAHVTSDQLSLSDKWPDFTDFKEKNILKVCDSSMIFIPELKENDLIDTSPTCRSPGRPLLCNQVDGSISSGENFLQKVSFNEIEEQDVGLYLNIDNPEVKNTTVLKEKIQKSNDKLGKRKRKEQLFYPTYHLPFKGSFKPMLFRNICCNAKRRNICKER